MKDKEKTKKLINELNRAEVESNTRKGELIKGQMELEEQGQFEESFELKKEYAAMRKSERQGRMH